MDEDDLGVGLGQWTALIRRSRLPDHLKLAALTIGSYADADGTSIHCGVARLAVDLDCGYSTARRHLGTLRKYGLVQLVARGNSYAGKADAYRLIIGTDVLDHVRVLYPNEYADAIAAHREANRAGEKGRRLRSPSASADAVDNSTALRSPMVSAELVDEVKALRSLIVSADVEVCAHIDGGLRSPMGEPPPSTRTFQPQPVTADDVTSATAPGRPQSAVADVLPAIEAVRVEGGGSQDTPAPAYGGCALCGIRQALAPDGLCRSCAPLAGLRARIDDAESVDQLEELRLAIIETPGGLDRDITGQFAARRRALSAGEPGERSSP